MNERSVEAGGKSAWHYVLQTPVYVFFAYMLYATFVGPYRTTIVHFALFLGAMLTVRFLHLKGPRSQIGRASDYLFAALTVAGTGYLVLNFERIINLWGAQYMSTSDMVFGCILIAVVLEAARRESAAFALLSVLAILYVVFGDLLPGSIGHAGMSFTRFLYLTAYTSEGIFGVGVSVAASYLFMFLLLSAAMEKTKTGDLIVGICNSYLGHKAGGPAKSAVAASTLLGMMVGSSIGNVVTTGTFTIPLMKRIGIPAHKAAAIETVASEGSQFLPPIMGAGAFLMAEFTGIPYASIALAAIIPAVLYSISVFVVVHIEAEKLGLAGLSKEDIPSARVLMADGWHLLIAPVLLIYLLIVEQYTPAYAGAVCVLVSVAVAMLRQSTRMGFTDVLDTISMGVLRAAQITAMIAGIGFVQQAMVTTGLGPRLTDVILALSDGTLPVTLILTVVVATLLGMGMPTTIAYIILAMFVAPALEALGVPTLAAHLFLFYFAIKSGSTPPVALLATVAASIAEANWWKTAITAFVYSLPGFIVAFMFVYAPELLGVGSPQSIILTFVTALPGVIAIACGLQGWAFSNLTGVAGGVARLALIVGAVMMVKPGIGTDFGGLALIAMAATYGFLQARKPIAVT